MKKKVYVKTEAENTHTRVEIGIGDNQTLTVLIDVLPPSASRSKKPCAVFQVWSPVRHKELCERIIIQLKK